MNVGAPYSADTARLIRSRSRSPALRLALGNPLSGPFVDRDTGEMVSDAEVAKIAYTAFTARKTSEQVTARLIACRVRRLNDEVAQDRASC